MVPQDKGDLSAACLDGSEYGFYYVASPTNSSKWTINIEGGGWCYDEASCLERSSTDLGSSDGWPKSSSCGCMNLKDGATWEDPSPIDSDCNCVYTRYCDGASFSGYRAARWPVEGSSDGLTFRGIKNFDALIAGALDRGLGAASDFVLTGGSAGGLSTFLHLDRAAAAFPKDASTRITGAPVVGFFLDHDNFAKDANNYTAWMKYVTRMQNLTAGVDGALSDRCVAAFPGEEHLCFMSPHAQKFVETPFFVFNSKFDAWQLENELGFHDKAWNTTAKERAVVSYGKDFDDAFQAVLDEPRNGAFITTCICHGCNWGALAWQGRNAYQAYRDWYVGNGTTFLVDSRGPNGDGALNADPKCLDFPSGTRASAANSLSAAA